ncbi:MAG: DUF4860 domain-containing protein [Lachnospiraceae bacterium]|nr:DUF4860 domain-containing protein [Lachnospiraceae bacterium]
MNFRSNKQHTIDIIFMLSLFCVFALCSVALIIFGANIYQNTVNKTNQNYLERTSVAYLTEKLRQTDIAQSVSIIHSDGIDMLSIESEIEGQLYSTRLYEFEGYLYECSSRSDIVLSPDAGQAIFKIEQLNFQFISPSLLQVTFESTEQELVSFYIDLQTNNT